LYDRDEKLTSGVEVQFVDNWGKFGGESFDRPILDAEARKHGDQKGLETLVVHAVNYGSSIRKFSIFNTQLPLITENLWNLKLTRKLPAWGLWPQG